MRHAIMALLLMGSPAGAQNPPGSLPVEDALKIRSFVARMPIRLSADGEWVAYTVRTSHRYPTFVDFFAPGGVPGESYESQIRVTHTTTGETHELTPVSENSWAPAWSPDGTRLAFYSDRDGAVKLWLWDRRSARSRKVSDEVAKPSWNWETPRWTPDGRSLVAKLLPRGTTVEQMIRLARRTSPEPEASEDAVSARVFGRSVSDSARPRPDTGAELPVWYRGAYAGDLAILDVASGQVRWLTSGLMPSWWEVSSDGAWVAFTHATDMDPVAGESRHALAVLPIGGGEPYELMRPLNQNWATAVSWSPTGALLAFISEGEGREDGLFVADARRRTLRRLSAAMPAWKREHQGPVWVPVGDAMLFTSADSLWEVRLSDETSRGIAHVPDRTILNVVTQRGDQAWLPGPGSAVVRTRDPNTGMQGFFRVSLASGATRRLVEEQATFGSYFTADVAADSTVVFMYANAQRPAELWLAGQDMQRIRRISRSNPQFDGRALGEPRLIEWTTPTGELRRGALLLPPDYRGGRLPLIVDVYGGYSASQDVNSFEPGSQLLATRGYALLLPDIPVQPGTPMRDIAEGVRLAVDKAIALGYADPARLGLIGHSYGGYSVLSVLVQSNRFRAAVASASQGNMFGMYSRMTPDGSPWTTWSERGQGGMEGTPWELRDRYIENSPYFHLDDVTTPLLLLHGGSDINTPAYLAEETYTALRRLEQTVEYVRYEGENHSPGMWRLANRIDYWQRIIAWFEKHL